MGVYKRAFSVCAANEALQSRSSNALIESFGKKLSSFREDADLAFFTSKSKLTRSKIGTRMEMRSQPLL